VTKKQTIVVAIAVVLTVGCGELSRKFSPEGRVYVDNDRRVKTGMTRELVVAKLGAASSTNWLDNDKPYFGHHFEDAPPGAKIEIWNYPDKHGTREVWFLNNSNAVWHTSFCGKNVVF
jgi:hypothetical protein